MAWWSKLSPTWNKLLSPEYTAILIVCRRIPCGGDPLTDPLVVVTNLPDSEGGLRHRSLWSPPQSPMSVQLWNDFTLLMAHGLAIPSFFSWFCISSLGSGWAKEIYAISMGCWCFCQETENGLSQVKCTTIPGPASTTTTQYNASIAL